MRSQLLGNDFRQVLGASAIGKNVADAEQSLIPSLCAQSSDPVLPAHLGLGYGFHLCFLAERFIVQASMNRQATDRHP
jgi:hypothetical protein